jgi:serine/threonine protein kinase
MSTRADWQVIGEPLGEGGQSEVFKVRHPARAAAREECLNKIRAALHSECPGIARSALDEDKRADLATAIWSYARPDLPSELGALKQFKIPPERGITPPPGSEEDERINRLKNEISALSQNRAGLPKLLDSNVAERWVVTEFFPEGTLDNHLLKYRGKAGLGLTAFRSLVQTVALLHQDGHIHRDIKPANVFVRADDELVLGDFGIVYMPAAAVRVTLTGERVGPRDYMPPWANLGVRHEKVEPCFDVYMLGKLLWSMVDGRAVLPREYHRDPQFDLTKTFRDDPDMYVINRVLDKCVVERSHQCFSGAQDLLLMVNAMLGVMKGGGQLLSKDVPRPCHVCGHGNYEIHLLGNKLTMGSLRFWLGGSEVTNLNVYPYVCTACGHVEFFAREPPPQP